jgi:hypothetical protein
MEALNKMGTKPTAQEACSKFTPLIENGNALLVWMRKEKEWCQIPDGFIERLTTDHKQVSKIQKQACDAAKAPPQSGAPGDSNAPPQQHDDKNLLTRPIPIPQGIPLQ